MKTQRNILIAFILNLSFCVFECLGGMFTGSVAIVSDAVHDLGDAAGIGISYFLERKSQKPADETYTYGYARYSTLGALITTLMLLIGSVVMIGNAISRILSPTEVNHNGMILLSAVGIAVNLCAAFFTRDGKSPNQKAVNLHMLEDVLGWIFVLVGGIVMRRTNFTLIDPLLSLALSLFILSGAIKNLKAIIDLFLEKAPRCISVLELKERLESIDGINDVHHIHLWSLDGQSNLATLHIATERDAQEMKQCVRNELHKLGIDHVAIETETSRDHCHETHCRMESVFPRHHSHHSH